MLEILLCLITKRTSDKIDTFFDIHLLVTKFPNKKITNLRHWHWYGGFIKETDYDHVQKSKKSGVELYSSKGK